MALEVHPFVIANFPVLFIIPAIIVAVIVAYAKAKGSSFKETWLGKAAGRLRTILLVVYIGQFGLLMLIAIIGVATESGLLIPAWIGVKFTFHISLVILTGALTGFILIATFIGRGVSAFLLASLLMSILPLLVLNLNLAAPAIETYLGFIDSVGILFIFIWPSSQDWVLGKMLGTDRVEESAKSKAMRFAIRRHAILVLEKLQRRSQDDEDSIASEAIDLLLAAEGETGKILREAGSQVGLLEQEIDPQEQQEDSTTHNPTQLEASPMRELKPTGPWTLRRREFDRIVWINRRAFVVLLSISLVVLFQAALSPDSILRNWTILLIGGFMLLSLLSFRWDTTFMGDRLNAEQIYEEVISGYTGIDEFFVDEEIELSEGFDAGVEDERSSLLVSPNQDRLLTADIKQQLSQESNDFLKRVSEGNRHVYSEGRIPEYTAIAGMLLCFPSVMILFLSSFNGPLVGPAVLFFAIGIIVILAGGFHWYKTTNERSFVGIRRGWLSVALSYLDVVESGIDKPGFVMFPKPPLQQLTFLHLGGPNISSKLMKELRKRKALESGLDESDEVVIEMKATLQNWEMSKSVLCLLPLVLFIITMISLMPFSIGGAMLPITLLLLSSVVILTFWPISLYSKKKKAEEYLSSERPGLGDRRMIVTELLRRMQNSYRYPLVLLVARDHPELYYTGKSFLTSNDVNLFEAVFLPR